MFYGVGHAMRFVGPALASAKFETTVSVLVYAAPPRPAIVRPALNDLTIETQFVFDA